MILDLYITYQFVSKLVKPFTEWDAFKLGIIDAEGNVLRKRKTLDAEEKKAWGYYDILIANLQKLISKLPGGSLKIATWAAALMLMKEHQLHGDEEPLFENVRDLESELLEMISLIERSLNHKVIKAYHGSNANFKQFDQGKSRIVNDFYGGGVAYFTSDMHIAGTYAKNMSKRGGTPIIYEVELTFNNLFDVDHNFTGPELTKFFDDKTVDEFARGARIMGARDDKYLVIGKLKAGDMTLTGDQVFRGLSNGMNNTAKARQKLISLGYDGLRHHGGVNMQQDIRHDVYLAYDADNIKIIKKFGMAPKQPALAENAPTNSIWGDNIADGDDISQRLGRLGVHPKHQEDHKKRVHKIIKIYLYRGVHEEAPTNCASSGVVSPLMSEPPLKKASRILRRKQNNG